MAGGASISNKTYRVIALMQALPRSPKKVTSSELHQKLAAEGHDISRRSVERYLEELTASQEFGGLIHCDDSSKPYGWSISAKSNLSIPGMDAQMAAIWDLVYRYLKPLMAKDALIKLEPVFKEARDWFKRHRPRGGRHWSDKVAYVPRGFALQPAGVAQGIADQVYQALYSNQQIEIWYKDKTDSQRVQPYALVDRGPVRYLIVRFWDYEDYRHLALHRLRKVKLLDQQVERASSFNLDAYLREGHLEIAHGKTIRMVLLFDWRAGAHLFETPINNSQEIEESDNGTITVTATAEHSEELKWWILGFGSRVKVLSPPELRQEISLEIKKANEQY